MKITIDHNQFVDLIVLFLLEQLTKERELEYSEDSQEFLDELERKGIKSLLLKHFFQTDSEMRRNYKFISDIFNKQSDNRQVIYLEQEK